MYVDLSGIESYGDVVEYYPQYLNDEAGLVKNGFAERIFFPKSVDEIATIVKEANVQSIPVTISGGGTGVSGGRVPLEGWIIATDKMRNLWEDKTYPENKFNWTDPETKIQYEVAIDEISNEEAYIHVPIAITLRSLQILLRDHNWFYPPDPTERLAYIGGNIATNASGARSFKYGVTKDWVDELVIVLPSGDILTIKDDDRYGSITNDSIIIKSSDQDLELPIVIPRPSISLPDVEKNVAGPVIRDGDTPIHIFIGSGGMFGIVAQARLRLQRPPDQQISMFVYLSSISGALNLVERCRKQKVDKINPIPMSIEFLGPRAVEIIRDNDPNIPQAAKCLLILEQDATSEAELDQFIEFWVGIFQQYGVIDTSVAINQKEIEHHKFLRHKVPETVNSIVRSYDQNKLGTDYSVPFKKLKKLIDISYQAGDEFEKFQNSIKPLGGSIGYVIWAHAGDAHIHLNLLPRTREENEFAKSLFIDLMRKVQRMNGSIAAEHGLGKKEFGGSLALTYQYDENQIDEIRKMKEAVDPKYLINRGNLIPYQSEV